MGQIRSLSEIYNTGAGTRRRMLDVGRELLDEISPFQLTPAAICWSARLTPRIRRRESAAGGRCMPECLLAWLYRGRGENAPDVFESTR
jgi:hypothetical protein